ncbi:MAG TPA: NAD-dependent epimerase/dehydratase family protein [Dongiaceae bacterium]|nr:NAD-dependent epimerase/dehydratase family protein [Dongiaceae bacterium]
MKIFVTGGTGFIGGHFLKKAIAAGHDVRALRRPGSKTRIPLPQELTWLEGNLNDDWSRELSQCAALVHLAAAGVNPQKANREELFDLNVRQSAHLWQQAAKAGVKRFVICGTCFEYGRSGERYEFIPVDAPLEPTHPYAESKVAATQTALKFAEEQKVELLVLRPFHVFGEGEEESRLWPSLRKAALAGEDFPMTAGEQVRDFVPVEKVAETFATALARTDLRAGEPRIENVGTGEPQTLRAFAEFWWRQWNAKGKLKIGDVPYRVNEVMRYVPQLSLRGK